MRSCITCSMPLEGVHASNVGLELPEGPVCKFDSENGQIKSYEAIFEGGVHFFGQYTDGDRALAERLTRTNMNSLPYWQNHHFPELDGEQATPEEFQSAMARM